MVSVEQLAAVISTNSVSLSRRLALCVAGPII